MWKIKISSWWIHVGDPSGSMWWILVNSCGGSWLIHLVVDPGESRWWSTWWILVDACHETMWIHVVYPVGSMWWIHVADSGGSIWWILADPCDGSLWIHVVDLVDPCGRSCGSMWWILVDPHDGSWWTLVDLAWSMWWLLVDPHVGSCWISVIPLDQRNVVDPGGSKWWLLWNHMLDPGGSTWRMLVDHSGGSRLIHAVNLHGSKLWILVLIFLWKVRNCLKLFKMIETGSMFYKVFLIRSTIIWICLKLVFLLLDKYLFENSTLALLLYVS